MQSSYNMLKPQPAVRNATSSNIAAAIFELVASLRAGCDLSLLGGILVIAGTFFSYHDLHYFVFTAEHICYDVQDSLSEDTRYSHQS